MARGIYLWTVNPPQGENTQWVYVGQAEDFRRRRLQYERCWRSDKPKQNALLHAAVRKYPRGVSFTILEEVPFGELTPHEQHWYWHYKKQEELGLCRVCNFVEPGTAPARKQRTAGLSSARR